MITVGLLTHNRSHILPRAIDSVLAQTFKDFRLIISDDNSTDDTRKIVEAYLENDSRIVYVHHSGIGMTQNFVWLLNQAKTEYFVWLCDDDYFAIDYLEKCIAFLQKNNDYSLCCGATNFFTRDGFLERTEYLTLEQNQPQERVISYFRQVNSNVILYGLMRTEQIRKAIYPDTFGADLLWSAQICFLGKIKILTTTNFFYSAEGISQSTDSLGTYYPTTRGNVRNPYLVLKKEAFSLIFDSPVFSFLSLPEKVLLGVKLYCIIRERFCMSRLESRVRGALRVRTRIRNLLFR